MPDSATVQRDDVEGAMGYLGVPETSLNCGSYSPIVIAPPDVFSLSVVRSSAKAIKFGVDGFCSKMFAITGRATFFLIFFSIIDNDVKPRPRIPSLSCWYVLSTLTNTKNYEKEVKGSFDKGHLDFALDKSQVEHWCKRCFPRRNQVHM
jgi:hypothetical protein